MRNGTDRQRTSGFLLLSMVLLVSGLTLVLGQMAERALHHGQLVDLLRVRSQAFHTAQSGLAVGLDWLSTQPRLPTEPVTALTFPYHGATATVTVTPVPDTDPPEYRLTSAAVSDVWPSVQQAVWQQVRLIPEPALRRIVLAPSATTTPCTMHCTSVGPEHYGWDATNFYGEAAHPTWGQPDPASDHLWIQPAVPLRVGRRYAIHVEMSFTTGDYSEWWQLHAPGVALLIPDPEQGQPSNTWQRYASVGDCPDGMGCGPVLIGPPATVDTDHDGQPDDLNHDGVPDVVDGGLVLTSALSVNPAWNGSLHIRAIEIEDAGGRHAFAPVAWGRP